MKNENNAGAQAEANRKLQLSINQHKVNIDRTIHQKTDEERKEIREHKANIKKGDMSLK
jgi:hypothetical protein